MINALALTKRTAYPVTRNLMTVPSPMTVDQQAVVSNVTSLQNEVGSLNTNVDTNILAQTNFNTNVAREIDLLRETMDAMSVIANARHDSMMQLRHFLEVRFLSLIHI
jgi:hypothetical protein